MTENILRENITNGINFTSVIDERFKTNRISANIIVPLTLENASSNSLLLFLLRKSYKDCPDFTQFNKKMSELYGSFIDFDVRKIGDNQVLNLSVTYIDDKYALDNENLTKELTDILCNIILNPALDNGKFKESEIELEKNSLINTIESELNDKRTYALNRLENIMFDGESYGLNKYGTCENVANVTNQSLLLEYDTLIKSAQFEILFVGCGNFNISKQIITEKFSNITRENVYKINNEISEKVLDVKNVTEKMNVAQSKLVMGFRFNNNINLDAARVMVALFGGSPSSKLFLNVREKLSLCYYCAARFDRIKNVMIVDSGVENQNVDKAKDEILHQLDLIKQGEFTSQELEFAKLSLSNSFNTVNDSVTSIEVWYLGQIFNNTNKSPQETSKKIFEITTDQVISVAKNISLDTVYLLTSEEK